MVFCCHNTNEALLAGDCKSIDVYYLNLCMVSVVINGMQEKHFILISSVNQFFSTSTAKFFFFVSIVVLIELKNTYIMSWPFLACD